MRYVIIPLLAILYIWWTTSAIKDIIASIKYHRYLKRTASIYDGYVIDHTTDSTDTWIAVHVSIAVVGIFVLSLFYW